MNAKRIVILLLIVTGSIPVRAQYVMSGKIEYEKKVNVHAGMKDFGDDNNSWFERMKSQIPKYNITYFDLAFNREKSLYKPGRESLVQSKILGSDPASDNIVSTDFLAKRVVAMKQVFEQRFLVQDSMRHLEWKLKDEIRTIAGFKCRKAVSIICDSVYVVAFYADDILAPGGPEMFGSLPGMILEIAIPRLHTTWVATKVEITPPKEEDYVMKPKGKKVTAKEMFDVVMDGLEDWGKWGTKYIWLSVL
jgi:GLPGLI family protein